MEGEAQAGQCVTLIPPSPLTQVALQWMVKHKLGSAPPPLLQGLGHEGPGAS